MGLFRRAEKATDRGETVAIVTVTAVEGSAPRSPGTSMLVREEGTIEGTIGGGTVEKLSRDAAVEAIDEGASRREEWELRPGGNTGMVCDGSMEVFINVLEGKRTLIVAGGGHIAVPVVRIGTELGYSPVVVEDRDEFADPDRFPDADVIQAPFEEGIAETTITGNTAIVIATRSSTFDRRAAQHALESDAFYVGCVASESKAEHIRAGLRDDGVDEASLDRLRAPVGLDLGADTPAQIALSILSEIESVRTGASGRSHSAPEGRTDGEQSSDERAAEGTAGNV